MMPRLTSIWAKRQSSAATTMSAASISSMPSVKQMPCTAHTSGLVRSGGRSDSGSTRPTGNTVPRSRMIGATLSSSRPAVKLVPLREQHADPGLLVALERREGLGQLDQHLGREAVELLGPVDADRQHAAEPLAW